MTKRIFISLFIVGITSINSINYVEAANPAWVKASTVKASDVVDYLMKIGYCDKISPPLDNSYTKKEYAANWSRTCTLKLKKTNVPLMQIDISTGKSFIFDKSAYAIYGVNWRMQFNSFETGFPGSFHYVYQAMNRLADTLGARAAGVPIPKDFCFFIWDPENDSNKSKSMVTWRKDCDAADSKVKMKELMDPPW